MRLDPGTIFAGHRIEAVAGQGGMGVVYKATQLALDITVALKVMAPELADDEEFRARFQRETQNAAHADHPNLIPVRHAGEEDGLLYVTMRYVDGTDLRRMIVEESPLEPAVVSDVISQVADGLAAAHDVGLVHRDVKPANILVERIGGTTRAYLTDFGLTRRQASSDRLTRTGSWIGTIDYVAPEQIQGGKIDGRADIYSLGCVLYEALTAQVPYPVGGEVPKIYAHLNEDPPSTLALRADLPPSIDRVIAHAMASKPEDRYSSAAELGRDVAEVLGARHPEAARPTAAPAVQPTVEAADQPTAAATPPTAEAAPPQSPTEGRRIPAWMLAAGGVAVVAIVALLVLGGGGGDDGGGGGSAGGGKQAAGLTPAAFRRKADAICTGIERRVEAASARGLDQARYLGIRASLVQGGVSELRALEPPAGVDAARYEEYMDTRALFAHGLRELSGALAENDAALARTTGAENERLARKKMAIGRRLGLKACADVLPPADRDEVEVLGARWLTGEEARSVCALQVTETFLESRFGGSTAGCMSAQQSNPLTSRARLTGLFGVAGVHATATYATDAGNAQVEADFDGGRWKVDALKRGA